MWRAQLEALEHAGFNVRVLNMLALDSIAAQASAMLAQITPCRFALVGFSLGGFVALEIVRRVPDRITGLALLSTSARADPAERKARRRENMDLAARGHLVDVVDAFVETICPNSSTSNADAKHLVQGMMRDKSPQLYVSQQRAIMTRPDSRADLSRVACPTLILCGEDDVVTTPELHAELRREIPHAQLVTVPNAGHMITLEAPIVVSDALLVWANAAAKGN